MLFRSANEGIITLKIGEPQVTDSRLALYRKFHEQRSQSRGWSDRDGDPIAYHESFVSNPFPTEEWTFWLGDELVGLGLVDALSVGLSAIYFVHDPEHSRRGLGVWNVLTLIEETRKRGLPYLYLGYWVRDCLSLAYKSGFRPNQILDDQGRWIDQPE